MSHSGRKKCSKQQTKCSRLTIEQKLAICRHKARNQSMSQIALAMWAKEEFNLSTVLSQVAIGRILKKRHEYEGISGTALQAKRPRTVTFPQLEEALAIWVVQCQRQRLPLTGELIKAKAREFAQEFHIPHIAINFSNGWLCKFQERHNLRTNANVAKKFPEMDSSKADIFKLDHLFGQYALCDVYNMDETGLCYSIQVDDTIQGIKTGMTVALATNADGSHKVRPFFIGHDSKPSSFNNKTGAQLDIYYRNSKTASMTVLLFQEWLLQFDDEMKERERHVLLLLDNCPFHVIDSDIELTNVRVEILTTATVQPMTSGIIADLKRRYRRFHVLEAFNRRTNQESNIFKVDLLTAIKWTIAAWKEITSEVIQGCFKSTGVLMVDEDVDVDNSIVTPVASLTSDTELLSAISSLRASDSQLVRFLDSVNDEEEEAMKIELTDTEIVKMVKGVDHDYCGNEKGDGVKQHLRKAAVLKGYSKEEKFHALDVVLSMLNRNERSYKIMRKRLIEMQVSLRAQQKNSKNTNHTW